MDIESFPYKAEFFNSNLLWENALRLNLAEVKTIKLPRDLKRWRSIPQRFRWSYQGKTVAIVVPKTAYDLVDKLVDGFSEDARMQAHRKGHMTPLDFYEKRNADVVKKAKELELSSPNDPWRHHLREAVYHLIPECTSFKISVTKAFLKFIGATSVLDPSAGWGDRILGAAAAGVKTYHGVDPNPLMKENYSEMIRWIRGKHPGNSMSFFAHGEKTIGRRYAVLTEDFLQTDFAEGKYDTVFTSPPFFDYEIYVEGNVSGVDKQSISGRETLEKWINEFLYPYAKLAWSALKSGGHLAFYISDTRSASYVEGLCNYVKRELGGTFLGIIAVTDEELTHAYPLWVWQKVDKTTLPTEGS